MEGVLLIAKTEFRVNSSEFGDIRKYSELKTPNYTATLIAAKEVIPAKAGIQQNTGFRVKPGMTNKVKGLLMHRSS